MVVTTLEQLTAAKLKHNLNCTTYAMIHQVDTWLNT